MTLYKVYDIIYIRYCAEWRINKGKNPRQINTNSVLFSTTFAGLCNILPLCTVVEYFFGGKHMLKEYYFKSIFEAKEIIILLKELKIAYDYSFDYYRGEYKVMWEE